MMYLHVSGTYKNLTHMLSYMRNIKTNIAMTEVASGAVAPCKSVLCTQTNLLEVVFKGSHWTVEECMLDHRASFASSKWEE